MDKDKVLTPMKSGNKLKKTQRFKLLKKRDDVGMRNNLYGNSINDIEFHPVCTNILVVAYSDRFIIFSIETRLNSLEILYSMKSGQNYKYI